MKVLIATDGSEYSNRAINESCRMFVNNPNYEVKVFSVFKTLYSIPIAPFAIPENYPEQIDKKAEEDARQITKEAAGMIRKKCPKVSLTTEIEKLANGTVGQKIIEKTKEWQPDLIVVGSHGRGFWGRLTIGSTSDAVIHNAPCPVLVVH